jgi:hypothetical protein
MATISLEAFDANLRGKYVQWIVTSSDNCSLPQGFQDQILSGHPNFQTTILILSKQDAKAWLLAYSWDLTFIPESNTDWSLLLSILQHMKKPILVVTTPQCKVPDAFWQKCITQSVPATTCVALRTSAADHSNSLPTTLFYPPLQEYTEDEFVKFNQTLHPLLKAGLQTLDLRTLYKELRGSGASLCLSQIDSRMGYSPMLFYPDITGELRLDVSDLRKILRTVTERLAEAI